MLFIHIQPTKENPKRIEVVVYNEVEYCQHELLFTSKPCVTHVEALRIQHLLMWGACDAICTDETLTRMCE